MIRARTTHSGSKRESTKYYTHIKKNNGIGAVGADVVGLRLCRVDASVLVELANADAPREEEKTPLSFRTTGGATNRRAWRTKSLMFS